MRQELKAKIIAFNREYKRVSEILGQYDMHLCQCHIFKGSGIRSIYMGHMNDYEKIIQSGLSKNSEL